MPRLTIRIDHWKKHAELLEKSDFQTIKELANNLIKVKASTTNTPQCLISGIKGIPVDDAIKMIIDLSLSVIPYNYIFYEKIFKKIKKTNKKITFNKVIKEIERLYPKEEISEDIKQQIAETIKRIKSGEIKNPLKVNTPFSENFLTNAIYERRTIQKISDLLKLSESKINKLKKIYPSRITINQATSNAIKNKTGLSINQIRKIKSALTWQKNENVSLELSVAMAVLDIPLDEIALMSEESLRIEIQNSGITVPDSDISDKNLGEILETGKSSYPEVIFFDSIINKISLSDEAINYLKIKKIKNFDQFCQLGILNIFIKEKWIPAAKRKIIEAYSRISKVTNNTSFAQELIKKNVTSAHKISKYTLAHFLKQFEHNASKEDLTHIHSKALQITLKTTALVAWSNKMFRQHRVDEVLHEVDQARQIANKIMRGNI